MSNAISESTIWCLKILKLREMYISFFITYSKKKKRKEERIKQTHVKNFYPYNYNYTNPLILDATQKIDTFLDMLRARLKTKSATCL